MQSLSIPHAAEWFRVRRAAVPHLTMRPWTWKWTTDHFLPPVGFSSCIDTLLSDEDSNVFMEELKPTRGHLQVRR